ARNALQKELAFVQGIVERKNTIPVLANILIESAGEDSIRISGTDLDVTIRCDADAQEISAQGAICVPARKLFDIARLLPDAPVSFRKEENEWVTVECDRSKFRLPGVSKETFPELPGFKSTPLKLPSSVIKMLIERTIFAITQEEGRYTLSGAKFELDKKNVKMVTTDGHRLAFVSTESANGSSETLDVLIPRKTLAELTKLTSDFDGDINLGADENHVYFQVGSRLLISRLLSGQFPNYEMVMPKGNDRTATFDTLGLNQAIRRVALMADDRSHAIRMHLAKEQLLISSQNAEEGEARETLATNFDGDETEIGFNAQYLQDFLNVVGSEQVNFEFKDGNSQAQLRPVTEEKYDYRYVVMPMRL
ncbi:MAG TPA: DNA polymerase III subunit beta, partial [Pyrinomonadaceae bacterium]|nr:DNA polymerase III subunit beta [Pyrinomonadaceae bacterium]